MYENGYVPSKGAKYTKFFEDIQEYIKRCPDCISWKPITQFSKHKARPDGLTHVCKSCMSIRQKNRTKLISKEKRQADHRKYSYGLSDEDYQKMLELQNGRCAICLEKVPILVIDHDHVTGKVRSLLCSKHNSGLGQFGDDPELLDRAAEYLRSHTKG